MEPLNSKLSRQLLNHGIDIEQTDSDKDTLILKAVPVNTAEFNKEKTNLLIRHEKKMGRFMVFVDENLKYTGPDIRLMNVFKYVTSRNGWRFLNIYTLGGKSPAEVIQEIMALLWGNKPHPVITDNSYIEEPQVEQKDTKDAGIESYMTNLTELVKSGSCMPTIGREREIEFIIATVLKYDHPKTPIITGESGIGKSNLIYGVTEKLSSFKPELQIMQLNTADLFSGLNFPSETDEVLKKIFNISIEGKNNILFLEDIQIIFKNCKRSVDLFKAALDSSVKLIGTVLPEHINLIEYKEMERRFGIITLAEPDDNEVIKILTMLKPWFEKKYDLKIDESCFELCLHRSSHLPFKSPSRQIHLMDLACSRAIYNGSPFLSADDIVSTSTFLKKDFILRDQDVN
ncbi:hypothetical protein JXQ31_02670 [candidate division KSB1 bacterium]|nr:hypothetical protein [candidate division KSB1 bacterium]